MKLAINPVPDLRRAKVTPRALYALTAVMAGCWLASQVAGAVVSGNFGPAIAAVVLAYLVLDSSLLMVRGRALGLSLVRFWALGVVAFAACSATGLLVQGVVATALSCTAGVLGLTVLVVSMLPKARAHGAAKTEGLAVKAGGAAKARKGSKDTGIRPGSWEDIRSRGL